MLEYSSTEFFKINGHISSCCLLGGRVMFPSFVTGLTTIFVLLFSICSFYQFICFIVSECLSSAEKNYIKSELSSGLSRMLRNKHSFIVAVHYTYQHMLTYRIALLL